jgi:hypothetical protein
MSWRVRSWRVRAILPVDDVILIAADGGGDGSDILRLNAKLGGGGGNMVHHHLEMLLRDLVVGMRLAQIAAAIDVGAASLHAEEVGDMLTQPVDIDAVKESGQLGIVKHTVIQAFGDARCHAAAIFRIERLFYLGSVCRI